jgi:hypothetical protein
MFDGARRIRFRGLDLVVLKSASNHRAQLARYRDDLIRLATYARGWGPEAVGPMGETFKIEPFFRATSLVLVFDRGRLCGTAGVDSDFSMQQHDGAIFHLCSVNLLEDLRHNGLTAFFILLLVDELLTALPASQTVYLTSISQSPQVYRLLSRLAHVFPDGRQSPPADVRHVARAVAARYDPHITLDEDRLILRNECAFFYRDFPTVADADVNALFAAELDVAAGDVFVNVGKTKAAAARRAAERYRTRIHRSAEAA